MSDTKSAAEFISERWPKKGPCLIARPGANVPNCHENDFCLCEMRESFEAGHASRDSEVAELVEALESLRKQIDELEQNQL